MYICECGPADDIPELVSLAVQQEAAALLLPWAARDMEGVAEAIPAGMPVHYVLEVKEVAHRLAVAFYGRCEQGVTPCDGQE